MASNTNEAVKTAPAESVYSAAELANNHRMFGVNRDIVVVALQKAGKAFATVSEAKAIINKFKSRTVGTTKTKKEDK